MKTTKDWLSKFSQTFCQSRKYTQAPFLAAFGHLRVLNILYVIVEISTLSDLWKEALREDIKNKLAKCKPKSNMCSDVN